MDIQEISERQNFQKALDTVQVIIDRNLQKLKKNGARETTTGSGKAIVVISDGVGGD